MPPKGRGGRGRGGKSSGRSNQGHQEPIVRSKVQLDVRESQQGLWNCFRSDHGLQHIEDKLVIFKELVPMKLKQKSLNLDTGYTVTDFHCAPDSPSGILQMTKGPETRAIRCFQKRIALLEPYRYMKFKERGFQPFLWNFQPGDIQTPENQAYVDVIGSALVSKLQGLANSPHFCEFYGSFRAVANTFLYNLEDDLEEFRFTRWFWQGIDEKGFGLRIVNKSTGQRLSDKEVQELLRPDTEYLTDTEDSDDESDSASADSKSLGAESLPCDAGSATPFGCTDLQETDMGSVASCKESPASVHTLETMSTQSSDSEDSFAEDYSVHAELYNMPVAVMFLEHMEGTMDELLEQSKLAPVKTAEQRDSWCAWLTQVCMALTQLQGLLGLTHNDLHTNNILWKSTTEEFLWYTDGKGRTWRVPTYGKIFTIIDYGRAIYTVNGYTCISSDYDDGHDAAGMYNFGPIEDKTMPRVGPCKSFDLCRLACSLLRGLYPHNPVEKVKGKVLTKEDSWVVRETDDTLFNSLWTWLSNTAHESILETETGEEKYPGFDLYQVIAATVKSAVPSEQLGSPWITGFLWKGALPTGLKPIHVPA